MDNNDNAYVGIEKYGFSFKTWCSDPTMTCEDDKLLVLSLKKRPCLFNTSSCNWKCTLIKQQRKEKQQQSTTNHHHYAALKHEYDVLSDVTVASPDYDYRIANAPNNNNDNELSHHSMSKAIHALQKYGLCMIKNMIPTNKAHAFDKAAKKDVNQIRNVIQHRYGIDLISDQCYSN